MFNPNAYVYAIPDSLTVDSSARVGSRNDREPCNHASSADRCSAMRHNLSCSSGSSNRRYKIKLKDEDSETQTKADRVYYMKLVQALTHYFVVGLHVATAEYPVPALARSYAPNLHNSVSLFISFLKPADRPAKKNQTTKFTYNMI
jgi:hypothetical protein